MPAFWGEGRVGQQGKDEVGGSQGRADLVGNIGHGVRQQLLVLRQGLCLFAEAQGHFGELAFQDGEFAFLVFLEADGDLAVEHIVNVMAELAQLAVAAPSNPIVGEGVEGGNGWQRQRGEGGGGGKPGDAEGKGE